jgi:hypothetical protein
VVRVRGLFVLLVVVIAAAIGARSAAASELIDRNATGVKLEVEKSGRALLTYRAAGRVRHVLAWGAINARHSHPSIRQVEFRLDYSGGWRTYRKEIWRTFRDACSPYDGPELHWYVVGCRAADGSYWAVQSWQRMLPGLGVDPTPAQAVWELRLSHWRGPLPELTIKLDWAYRRYDHLYGTYAYLGHPIFGFRVTSAGAPLDTYGRNVYLDTFNSAYGRGWKRERGFLTQNPRGNFCYGFFAHGNRPSGKGERYRATISGPGVTPDAYWEFAAPGPYNRDLDLAANAEQRELAGGSRYCRPN